MTFLTVPLSGPSASSSQYADAGQKVTPARWRGMRPEGPVARKRDRSIRPGKKDGKRYGNDARHRRGVRRSADRQDCCEIIRTAILVGKALSLRAVVVMALVLGMDRIAIAAGPTGHHIGPAMLSVLVDIQARHGEQIPYGKQHRGNSGKQTRYVSFSLH